MRLESAHGHALLSRWRSVLEAHAVDVSLEARAAMVVVFARFADTICRVLVDTPPDRRRDTVIVLADMADPVGGVLARACAANDPGAPVPVERLHVAGSTFFCAAIDASELARIGRAIRIPPQADAARPRSPDEVLLVCFARGACCATPF